MVSTMLNGCSLSVWRAISVRGKESTGHYKKGRTMSDKRRPQDRTTESGRPEPHRDQRTIGSFKRTCNAALLLWVAGRAAQHAPRGPLRPARLVAGAAVAAVLIGLGLDPTSLPGLP